MVGAVARGVSDLRAPCSNLPVPTPRTELRVRSPVHNLPMPNLAQTFRYAITSVCLGFPLSVVNARQPAEPAAPPAITVRSIDPDQVDFRDLEPIAAKIGTARIVLLGEATHGDGATLLAKCRLVKFLHESMGFDVLAFESGICDARYADAALRGDGPVVDAASKGIFGLWAESAQSRPVFEYIRATARTARPLHLAGIDPQTGTPPEYAEDLRAVLTHLPEGSLGKAAMEFVAAFNQSFEAAAGGDSAAKASACASLREIADAIETRSQALAPFAGATDRAWHLRCLRGMAVALELYDAMSKPGAGPGAGAGRAAAMAENAAFLLDEMYKGRKIIIWSNTFHTLRNLNQVRNAAGKPIEGVTTMGSNLAAKFGDDVYTIAFVSAGGTSGVVNQASAPIAPASDATVESRLVKAGKPFCFLDLRRLPESDPMRGDITTRVLGHQERSGTWSKVVDALFFVQNNFPSTREGRQPDGAVLTAS